MTQDNEYEYDVAFSFTQKDEELAIKLYKLLSIRLRCFIYTEEQKRLAGRDGEEVFNLVFSKQSRIVVIIYRNDYGKTKWTRIEEYAIRNRGFDHGYDFVLLIPLDSPVKGPDWLPKNKIWIGLERWGIESAASVIEARVQDSVGTLIIESIADIAAKEVRLLREKKERKLRITLENCLIEIPKIIQLIEEQVNDIKFKAPDWRIIVKKNKQGIFNIISYDYYLTFQFYQQFTNSLTGAFLRVALIEGYLDENGYTSHPFNDSMIKKSVKLKYDIDHIDQIGWSDEETGKNFMTSKKLVEFWIGKLIEYGSKKRSEQSDY